jgi:hypothetical protein
MRSISRLAVFAALLGTGLSAHADSSMPDAARDPLEAGPMVAQAPVTLAAPAREPLGEAPRASVAAIMQDAGQALLWDSARGEYVLVRAGAVFQGFHVSAISAEQVVLSRGNQHFVLPRMSEAPDLARRSPVGADLTASPAAPAAPAQGGLVDPYAATGAPAQPMAGLAPQTPGAGQTPPAQAPLDPYASPASPAPASPAPAFFSPDELPPAPGPMDPYAAPAAPAAPGPVTRGPVAPSLPSSLLESRVKPLPRAGAESRAAAEPRKSAEPSAPVAASDTARVTSVPRPVIQSQGQSQGQAATLRDEQHSLSRKEFDAAITDFDALGRDMQVTQTADGVRVDEVASGSLAYRMGVRAGDVVLDIDGKKLRSMNDAAAIYARLMDAERFAVKVRRGTGIITLRYRFTR